MQTEEKPVPGGAMRRNQTDSYHIPAWKTPLVREGGRPLEIPKFYTVLEVTGDLNRCEKCGHGPDPYYHVLDPHHNVVLTYDDKDVAEKMTEVLTTAYLLGKHEMENAIFAQQGSGVTV